MTAVQIWLWLRLDAIGLLLTIGALCGIMLGIVGVVLTIGEHDPDVQKLRRWCRAILILGLICLPLAVLCPTTKQMAVIYVAPKLIESSAVTNDIPELYDMAVECLKYKMATAKAVSE